MRELDAEAIDAVRELVNIASGNAATALAAMVGERTMIGVPRVSLEPVDRIASILGMTVEPTVVVAMQVVGDLAAYLLFLMSVPRAHALSAVLLGRAEPTSGEFDALARSALQETANVLGGAYTGALGSLIAGIVMISVPSFAVEPPDDVLARYRTARADLDQALCIETSIMIGRRPGPCEAHIVLLPLGGAMDTVLCALGSPKGRTR